MPQNSIKADGDSRRLQVTKPARAADLVEEQGDGDSQRTTYRADVYVHAFDGIIVIGDESLEDSQWAEIVAKTAEYTDSSFRCDTAKIQHDGNGYSVALPVASDAGFELGGTPGVHPAPGVIILSRDPTVKIGIEVANLRIDQQK